MIVATKLSRMITLLIDFQSRDSSPNRKQIDSRATLTGCGGLDMERISTRCCLLIVFTATGEEGEKEQEGHLRYSIGGKVYDA